MQKGSESILSSISYQKFAVSPSINNLVYLCPNLWCKNPEATFFLGAILFYLYISFVLPKNSCFLCGLCGRVTAFFFSSPKFTVQNSLWNKQVCHKFITLIIENNLSNISGTKSMLCNVTIKGSPLLVHIFIWTCPFCFAVTFCPSATSIYSSVSSNKLGIKSETCGVIRPLVSYKCPDFSPDFAGNSYTQKLNKAKTKRANIVTYSIYLEFGPAYTRINRSAVNFVFSCLSSIY